jgi:hypothetical protein
MNIAGIQLVHHVLTIYANASDAEVAESRDIEGIYRVTTIGDAKTVTFQPLGDTWKQAAVDCGRTPEEIATKYFGRNLGSHEVTDWASIMATANKTQKLQQSLKLRYKVK